MRELDNNLSQEMLEQSIGPYRYIPRQSQYARQMLGLCETFVWCPITRFKHILRYTNTPPTQHLL